MTERVTKQPPILDELKPLCKYAFMLKLRKSLTRGFTLLEILAVMTILGIIMAAVVPQVMKQLENGKKKTAKVLMNGIQQSLNSFQLDCGTYPTTEQGLEALITAPTIGTPCKNYDKDGYFPKKTIPNDPWNKPFVYISPGKVNPGNYDLYSTGPDRQDGTDDDIKAWE
jgi:general secretion pathway protein G